jgi:predicted glycosyltransferase involved in capsule biosynthesis
MLTIITPVYCQSKQDHIYERTKFFIKKSYTTDTIKRIIVDFGSIDTISSEIEELCNDHNFKYYNLHLQGNPFSAGECRNFGISKADTDYITFQDIDLYAPDSIYEKIVLRLSESNYYNNVECVPCLYLTEEFSNQYLNNGNWDYSHKVAHDFYKENSQEIKMYAPVTSMLLIRRQYLLESGGNNTEFYGHGYEDFELLNRLANRSNKFIRSRDFYNHDYKYTSADYCGYRTYFSLFGREMMNDKIFFVHIWHPENIAPSYSQRNQSNREIFNKLLRKFDSEFYMPPAISGVSENYQGKTLILSPFAGKTTNSIRIAIPYLGECQYKKDTEFSDTESFLNYINENEIKRVLFFNSFGNNERLKIYQCCLENNIKTINYDRGGLPDTWFFDSQGFNYSSKSYHSDKWDIKLDTEQTDDIQKYIQDTLITNHTLERNGERIGAINFSKKYNIVNKNIIFVPLQRPNDSVIRYFSDKIGSVENFIEQVKILAESLKDKNWVIVIKQHPLESEIDLGDLDNIVVMGRNDHFCDAIMASDATLLINSGVGLYSLMGNKPTYNVGNAYYSHEGLSNKIDSPLDLISLVDSLSKPNKIKVESFIHYLKNKFYSHGTTKYLTQINPITKSSTNNAIFTDFSVIRIPLDNEKIKTINISRREEPFKITSSYYDYYRSAIVMRNKTKPEHVRTIKNSNSKPEILKETQKSPIDMKQSINNTIIDINPQIVSKGKFRKKASKLVKSPRMFFSDAVKNIKNKNHSNNQGS